MVGVYADQVRSGPGAVRKERGRGDVPKTSEERRVYDEEPGSRVAATRADP